MNCSAFAAAICALVVVSKPVKAQVASCGEGPQIGVVYVNTETGVRHRRGIEAAIADHTWGDSVCVQIFPYVNRDQGVSTIRNLIAEGRVDVILGPTESDVFAGGIQSGLVCIARVDNRSRAG